MSVLVGCADRDTPVQVAKPLNPGGAPRDARESQMSAQQRQSAENANAMAAKAAQEMAAAKARSGGR